MEDYDCVYEPAEDTYLMCDALLQDEELLLAQKPRIVLEIGSGSGCNITYLSQLLKQGQQEGELGEDCSSCIAIATDINERAVDVTKRTAAANHVTVEVVETDLVSGLEERLQGHVDVLLFNPPYVPTPDEEVGTKTVTAAWAGGVNGRRVIDRFLPLLPQLLSRGHPGPSGCCYLVLVQENKPDEISAVLRDFGLKSRIALQRRARNEALQIMKIEW